MSALHGFGQFPASVCSLRLGALSPAWIHAGVTALSVLLTGGLVYLYHEQRRLNALEYTADVQPEGHRPSDDGTALDVCLSNLGRGAATGLSLRFESAFPGSERYFGREVEDEPIKRLEQPNADDVRNEWARPRRNYVGPERYFVQFWTTAPVGWTTPDGEADKAALARLAAELPDSVDRVRLTITLDYQDQSGNSTSEQLVDDVLPLEPREDLEYLLSRGLTNEHYVERRESDHVGDPFEKEPTYRPHLVTDSENER